MPASYQGTIMRSQGEPILDLKRPDELSEAAQRRLLDTLKDYNIEHEAPREDNTNLAARIASYELAFKMQSTAPEAVDLSQEDEKTKQLYGLDEKKSEHFGKQCLMARRLVERGVRFVQLWHGQGQPWDHHDDIAPRHRELANQCDRAIAALISDLKRLGLFEETLIVWGGEFGRTPTVELPQKGANEGKVNGRDHNHWGFTCWLAGGGVKGGQAYGATDEFGFKAIEKPTSAHDLHATILHLLGFDHEKLTYRYAGRDFRLTDVSGKVIREILA
jgi:uncharacterized protein (DUF1501 family)